MTNHTRNESPRQPADVWADVLTDLRGQTTQATFDQWLAGTQPVSANGTGYVIEVASEQARDWLDNRLKEKVELALAGVVGGPVGVAFVVKQPTIVEIGDPPPPTIKQAEIELAGYTMVFDVLVERYDRTTALVFGNVWRYCQMKDKVCKVSQKKLGERIGVSVKTIERKLKLLCNEGFLEDLTPSLKNKPHIYRDTGKMQIKATVEAVIRD